MKKQNRSFMTKAALVAALFGAGYSPVITETYAQHVPKAVHSTAARKSIFKKRKNTGTGNGRKKLPKVIQDMLIVDAEIRRKSRAMRAYRNGLKRDAGYYRANYESNNNRFVFLKTIEV